MNMYVICKYKKKSMHFSKVWAWQFWAVSEWAWQKFFNKLIEIYKTNMKN